MSLYAQFLNDETEVVLPWLGGGSICSLNRSYRVAPHSTPQEFGWYRWRVSRRALLLEHADTPAEIRGRKDVSGYLVGRHLLADDVAIQPNDLQRSVRQGIPVLLLEDGLPRFSRVVVTEWFDGHFIFKELGFGFGPEDDVQCAYEDRLESVDQIPEVAPALDLAFRWETLRRNQAEERRRQIEEERQRREAAELARIRAEEQQREYLRRLAERTGSFEERARRALAIMGAELLDWRESGNRGEMVVSYRFRNQRFQCTCELESLAIIDAGVCLDEGGEQGDRRFTLESLPAVVAWIIDDHGGLYRTRHV